MDPGFLPPPSERDPQTGLPKPARGHPGASHLLAGLAMLLLLGAALERSIGLACLAAALLFSVWGAPALWRRWRARRSGPDQREY